MVQKSILTDTADNLIKKYKDVLKENGIDFEKIIIFGSYAKGTYKPWSDLDICVVSKKFGKDKHEERIKLMKLAGKVDEMIEPHPYRPEELQDPFDPLAHEITKTGKIV